MSICWIHQSQLYKCKSCKLVHCKLCYYYPCKLKIYYWKCCGIEHKIEYYWSNISTLKVAKTYLEKHESKIHKSKKIGVFGFYFNKQRFYKKEKLL